MSSVLTKDSREHIYCVLFLMDYNKMDFSQTYLLEALINVKSLLQTSRETFVK